MAKCGAVALSAFNAIGQIGEMKKTLNLSSANFMQKLADIELIIYVYPTINLNDIHGRSFKVNSQPTRAVCWYPFLKVWTLIRPDVSQNVEPDVDPNCLSLWWYLWNIFILTLILTKYQETTKTCKSFQHAKLCIRVQSGEKLWKFIGICWKCHIPPPPPKKKKKSCLRDVGPSHCVIVHGN